MDESPAPVSPVTEARPRRTGCGCGLTAAVVLALMIGVAWDPAEHMRENAQTAGYEQQERRVGQALFAYSVDNNGQYPDGNTSTEIFQSLLDHNYVSDPAIFYIPMPSKRAPIKGEKLKPENVSMDMTGGVGSGDSADLPLVFSTGFRITYVPGGAATPLIQPFPRYGASYDFWPFTLTGVNQARLTVFYLGNRAEGGGWDSYLPLTRVVPATFDAKGKTYRQLTPDGVLAPDTK